MKKEVKENEVGGGRGVNKGGGGEKKAGIVERGGNG